MTRRGVGADGRQISSLRHEDGAAVVVRGWFVCTACVKTERKEVGGDGRFTNRKTRRE